MDFYRDKVRKWYQESITLNQNIDSELKRALKVNERVPNFIDNLSVQFSKIQTMRAQKGKKPLKEKTLQTSTYEMIDWFIKGIKNDFDKRVESEAKKTARAKALQYQKDLEASADGKLTGEFTELEVIEATDRKDLTLTDKQAQTITQLKNMV
jgi:hypothetical protein